MAFHVKRENKNNQYDFHAASREAALDFTDTPDGLPSAALHTPPIVAGLLAHPHLLGRGLQAGRLAALSLAPGRMGSG